MKVQAACFSVDLDKESFYSPKRLDNPGFVDLLVGNENSKNYSQKLSKNINPENSTIISDTYQTQTSQSNTYEYKNGNVKQISGNQNKQSLRDYLSQKFIAIQALKDQIDSKEELNSKLNLN